MKDLIKKHFRSAGFKRRLFNWYLPALKMGFSWVYTKIHGYFERRYYTKEYATDKVIEQVPSASEVPVAYTSQNLVLEYDKAVEIMRKYQIEHEPQVLGTCVAHTIKNSIKLATKIAYDKTFDLSEGDVYIDRETLPQNIDGGMYPDRAFRRVSDKGIAIAGMVPTAKSIADLQKTTRKEYPDKQLAPYRIKPFKSSMYVAGYRDFDALWGYITNEYAKGIIRPFQASTVSYANWWGSDVPKPTGNILGAHSWVGVTIPFMYKGERAFFSVDSAYNRGTVWRVGRGIRIVTESTWRGLGNSARKIVFDTSIENKLGTKMTTPVGIKVKHTAKMGNSGEQVTMIQKALIKLGYDIPAITNGGSQYGYYGQQTANAVLEFHLANWELFSKENAYWNSTTLRQLGGRSFGSLSVKVINRLLA